MTLGFAAFMPQRKDTSSGIECRGTILGTTNFSKSEYTQCGHTKRKTDLTN